MGASSEQARADEKRNVRRFLPSSKAASSRPPKETSQKKPLDKIYNFTRDGHSPMADNPRAGRLASTWLHHFSFLGAKHHKSVCSTSRSSESLLIGGKAKTGRWSAGNNGDHNLHTYKEVAEERGRESKHEMESTQGSKTASTSPCKSEVSWQYYPPLPPHRNVDQRLCYRETLQLQWQ